MPSAIQNYLSGVLALAASALLLLSCTTRKDPSALPDLPQSDVQKLQLVPNTDLLATRSVQPPPAVPPAPTEPPPPCTADDIITYYTVEADYPVTVCQPFTEAEDLSASFLAVRDPTNKVLTSSLSPDVQSVVNKIRWAGGTVATMWSCRTKSGPWEGSLSSEHSCFGMCTLLNTLNLSTPNPVSWSWYGSPKDLPPGVQYVHPPVYSTQTDLGSCHVMPSAKN